MTLKLITRWPALVILPCFGPFAFSGEEHEKKKVLVASRFWTFVNLVLTLICAISGILAILGPSHLILILTPSLSCLGFSLTLTIITFYTKCCCTITMNINFELIERSERVSITHRTGCRIADNDTLVLIHLNSTKDNPEVQELQNIECLSED